MTNAEYARFCAVTEHKPPPHWVDGRYPPDKANHPVVNVSWEDARAYCQWAGKRLPTEAEWEKAARGGLVGKEYPWGDDELSRGEAVDFSGWTSPKEAAPVGSFIPNGYGLYDMAGNAWEWCADWYDEDYYKKSVKRNPAGPGSGKGRVLRGGSWPGHLYTPLPVSYRYSLDPEETSDLIGFRCVK